MAEDRVSAFINSFDQGNTEALNELEDRCISMNVPVIRTQMQSLIKFLLAVNRPQEILEVGTAIGFSALFMSEYAPEGCHITTIENYEKRIPLALENIRKAGKEEAVTLLQGDAAEILKRLDGPYDFIFMDAAKGQYLRFLPDVLRLLRKGGLLVSDNVLQDGDMIESRFALTRRKRTTHSRMRQYLYELKHRDELETVILQDGDGAAVSVRVR